MAPFTKAMAKETLARVINVLFDFTTDNVSTALEQYPVHSVCDLLTLTNDDIDSLTYENAQGASIAIAKGDWGKLRQFKYFHLHMAREGNRIVDDE